MLLLAAGTAGCIETVTHPAVPRADPDRTPTTMRETRRGEPVATTHALDDTVTIAMAETTLCRTTALTPQVEDRVTERTLTPGGWIGQLLLLGGAAGAGAFGGYMLANPCTVASGVSLPCVEQAQDINTGVGVGFLVVAGALGAVFLGNAFGTIDTTNTVEAEPLRRSSSWEVCGFTPMAGATVEVWFSNGYVATMRTSSYGVARLDLATVPAAPAYASHPKARVRWVPRVGAESTDVGEVVFRGTSLHARSVKAEAQLAALLSPAEPPSQSPSSASFAGLATGAE